MIDRAIDDDSIFRDEQLMRYAEKRLFGKNARPEDMDIRRIVLCNAVLPDDLRKRLRLKSMLSLGRKRLELVEQENAREPLYRLGGTIYYPQFSGFGRQRRTSDTISEYIRRVGHSIVFEERFRPTPLLQTAKDFIAGKPKADDTRNVYWYEFFAYDFVKGIMQETKGFEGIDNIIFGSLDAVVKHGPSVGLKLLERHAGQYLDYQIIEIGGKRAVNINYVYADQIGMIIDKMMREYYAIAESTGSKKELYFYLFGRAAGMAGGQRINSTAAPAYCIDEYRMLEGRLLIEPLENMLAEEGSKDTNLNALSVSRQKKSTLRMAIDAARDAGYTLASIEMEGKEGYEAVAKGNRRYAGKVHAQLGQVFHISDLPMEGVTLADEQDFTMGEERCAARIFEHIMEGHRDIKSGYDLWKESAQRKSS